MTDVRPLTLFLWARRMGTMPQFLRAATPPHDLTVAPVFWDALPRAVTAALTELFLILERVWRRSGWDVSLTNSAVSTLSDLSWLVASFLAGSALAISAEREAAARPSPLLVGATHSSVTVTEPQTPLAAATLPPGAASRDTVMTTGATGAALSSPSTSAKRPRSPEFTTAAGAQVDSPTALATPRSTAATGANQARPPPQLSLADDDLNAVFVEGDSHGASLPEFFVLPPYDGITCLFVRMRALELLSDEQLNRFFGRYGQIRSQRLRAFYRTSGEGDARDEGLSRLSERSAGRLSTASVGGSHTKAHTPHATPPLLSGSMTTTGAAFLQDFLVWVDSPANAVAAVVELRHSEVVAVAFHSTTRNCYSAADLLRSGPKICHENEWRAGGLGADARVGALGDGDDGSDDSGEGHKAPTLVPELLVDHLPYWFTAEQIAALVPNYHDVLRVRLSIDDRSGAVMGCALLQMNSVEATALAAKALHGKELEEGAFSLVCGVATPNLAVHHLQTDEVLCDAPPEVTRDHLAVHENQRLWL